MKQLLIILGVIFSLPLWSAVTMSEEFAGLNHLIEVTRENLQEQEKLLKTLQEYARARDAFLEDSESRKKGSSLVRKARELEVMLSSFHLEPLFSTPFLEEITFFSSLVKESKKTA